MKSLVALYSPRIIKTLVYMLQASEYRVLEYLSWVHRTRDFSQVIKRKKLVLTQKSVLLIMIGTICYVAIIWLVITLVWQGGAKILAAIGIVGATPFLIAYFLTLPLLVGKILIQQPREKRLLEDAAAVLRKRHCRKIAIAGSYGKTTFKETLATVLSETLHVAASPGNMNTPLGIANFTRKLDGSEDVLIFELGEEKVGDVQRLCELTRPNMGIITGISEAHMNSFGSIEHVVSTIFELSDYLKSYEVYKNGDSELVATHVSTHDQHVYSEKGVNGWKVSDVTISLKGTSFTATKHSKTIWAHSKLLGKHQVGPLTACIDIADKLGMSLADIAEGIKRTEPFEHRMQPYELAGATIIDDTYNGNPKGIEAGLDFLATIEANRKIFITPGLVEQGEKSAEIHETIGRQAADICDVVVLMRNSTTDDIIRGLQQAHFRGVIKEVDDPLKFYTNLQQFVAAGDVLLMQNDWTDNYA